MTNQERESMYIANCLICTLAEAMKDCPKCLFKGGLVIKASIKAENEQKEREIKNNG